MLLQLGWLFTVTGDHSDMWYWGMQDWGLETITEADQRWSLPEPDELAHAEKVSAPESRRRIHEPLQNLTVRAFHASRIAVEVHQRESASSMPGYHTLHLLICECLTPS